MNFTETTTTNNFEQNGVSALHTIETYCDNEMGFIGKFIVKKQLENLSKDEKTFSKQDIPVLIEAVIESVKNMSSPAFAKELRKKLRKEFGLSI